MKNTVPPSLTFRQGDGLLGIPPSGRGGFIDEILALADEAPEERRELIMDPRLLATLADFGARLDARNQDEYGTYIVLKHGGRAYDPDAYADFLRGEPKLFDRLTLVVERALFERFVVDAQAFS
jgi:hypothetical protein